MKLIFMISLLVLTLTLAACATPAAQNSSLPEVVTTLPDIGATEVQASTAEVATTLPIVAETLTSSISAVIVPTSTNTANTVPQIQNTTSYTVVLGDNSKTFNLHVGDSLLLNLGADVYDWDVSIDDQSVVSLRMGVLVIQGAQGLYDAHAPGTAIFTAAGNPKCHSATPPCMMPSILFRVMIIVQ